MWVMSISLRRRLTSALNCTAPGARTSLHSSFQTLGSRPAPLLTSSRLSPAVLGRRQPRNAPPLRTAQAVHEVVTEEHGILDSVNYELATHTPADWVRLFETGFALSVEHLRQRSPQGTGKLLSLLARVPSVVLASLALPTLPGVHAKSCLVPLVRVVRSASLDARPLGLPALLSLTTCQDAGSWELPFLCNFSHLSLDLSTDLISHSAPASKKMRDMANWRTKIHSNFTGLGQLLAVRGSLRVTPRWLGPPPPRASSCSSCAFCLWPLFTCEAGGFLLAIFFSSQFEPVDCCCYCVVPSLKRSCAEGVRSATKSMVEGASSHFGGAVETASGPKFVLYGGKHRLTNLKPAVLSCSSETWS